MIARRQVDVLVIGAGMSGLTAAARLVAAELDVLVVDKGLAVGGRMATRRFGGARFDHGAQHFSVRSDTFRTAVDRWTEAGVVDVWFRSRSITDPERGLEPRHRGVGAMRGVCQHIASGLSVRTATEVTAIDRRGTGIVARWAGGPLTASTVIVTAPVAQTRRLLQPLAVDLSPLDRIEYRPCLAALLVVDRSTGLPDGHVATEGDDTVAWIADNQHKGVSSVAAVTVHSTTPFAEEMLESGSQLWLRPIIQRTRSLLDREIVASMGHRWRYAEPLKTLDSGALVVDEEPLIVVAGEALAGARVEGAYLSGLAAADLVLAHHSVG